MIDEQALVIADLGASWVLWLLVGLSVLTLGVAVERGLYFLRSRDDDALAKALAGAAPSLERLQDLSKSARSIEARVLKAGLEVRENGEEAVSHRMAGTLQQVQGEAGRRLTFLGTVGSNAPFVGLLGTVIGVVRSFQALNASQGQVSAGLMSEVGEALVATAIGILVALPAVAFYNYFQQLIRQRVERAEASSRLLLAALSSHASRHRPLAVQPSAEAA